MRNADDPNKASGQRPKFESSAIPTRPAPRWRPCASVPAPVPPPVVPVPLPPPVTAPPLAPASRGMLRGFARLSLVAAAVSAVAALVSAEFDYAESTGRERVVPYVIALLCGLSAFTFTLAVGWVAYRWRTFVFYGLIAALATVLTAGLLSSWVLPLQLGYLPGFVCVWGLAGFVTPYAAYGIYAWIASGFRG